MTKRKAAAHGYRVASAHSVELDGGRMVSPGTIIDDLDRSSEHNEGLIDDGHLVALDGDAPEQPVDESDAGGADEAPKIPDVSEGNE